MRLDAPSGRRGTIGLTPLIGTELERLGAQQELDGGTVADGPRGQRTGRCLDPSARCARRDAVDFVEERRDTDVRGMRVPAK